MTPVLASKSPRRKEILSLLFGEDFKIISSDADESSSISSPSALVRELSRRKADAVCKTIGQNSAETIDDPLVIAADTVVFAEGEILGKPRDRADAERMINLLRGKAHSVFTGLTVIYRGKTFTESAETRVFFDEMSNEEIKNYVSSGECDDKAGAYAVQGLAAKYIKKIDGDYFNVVGLPLHLLVRMLKENFGLSV